MARRGAVRRGWGRSARHKRRGAHKRAARKRFPTNAKKYPSTLVIAAQRPASSFRGRIVLQLPRSLLLLLLARLQTVLPRDGLVVPRRGDGRDRDAHNNGGFTRATRCQHNSRRDCAAAIRVGGAQEQRRQLAAFGDCGSSRASAFTLGAGRWGSNAAALPVVTRVARVARTRSASTRRASERGQVMHVTHVKPAADCHPAHFIWQAGWPCVRARHLETFPAKTAPSAYLAGQRETRRGECK